MKLNKTQVEYAIRRLDENIKKKLSNELGPKPVDKLSDEVSLIAHITSKKAKLKPNLEKAFRDSYAPKHAIPLMYEFPSDFNKEFEDWKEKEAQLKLEYENKKQAIVDQLHLSGDAKTALSLINSI